MKHKASSYIIGLITISAMIIFIGTLVHATVYMPGSGTLPLGIPMSPLSSDRSSSAGVSSSAAMKPKSVPTAPPASYPKRLSIPALTIDASVQEVGVTSKGTLGTPNNFTDVAWYAYGVVPGKSGTAIIDGHVDNGLGLAGVFKNLSNIKIGNDVYVVTYGGTKLHFVVTNIAWYDYENVPLSALSGQSGGSSLVLITCGGTWVPNDKTYDKRLVVTAELVKT